MTSSMALVFWSLALFETKHFVCDFVLQSRYQWSNKGIYGHPGGLIHAGLHAFGSLPALLILGASASLTAVILIAEFLVHYHIDWLKEQINKRFMLSRDKNLFWAIFGADQFLHQMTYLVILAVFAEALGL